MVAPVATPTAFERVRAFATHKHTKTALSWGWTAVYYTGYAATWSVYHAALGMGRPLANSLAKIPLVQSAAFYLRAGGGVTFLACVYYYGPSVLTFIQAVGSPVRWIVGPAIGSALEHVGSEIIGPAITNTVGFLSPRLLELCQRVNYFFYTLTLPKAVGHIVSIAAAVSGVALSIGWSITSAVIQEPIVFGTFGAYLSFLFAVSQGPRILNELTDYYALKAKKSIDAPELAMETRHASRLSWPAKKLLQWYEKRYHPVEPTFNENIQSQVNDIIWRSQNAFKEGFRMGNVLLSGPPGVGKTFLLKKMARDAGYNYVMMSGSDLAQYIKLGTHVSEFNKLIKYYLSSPYPTIFFIDEVDSCAGDRDTLDQAHQEILNCILTATGDAESEVAKKIMFCGATNRPGRLDSAYLSRMTYKIYVDLPNYRSRVKIFSDYCKNKFINNPEILQGPLNDRAISRMAAPTSYQSARAIEGFVETLVVLSRKDKGLTEERIHEALYNHIWQERSLKTAVRAWRPIEMISDAWYFHLPRLIRKIQASFESFKIKTGIQNPPTPIKRKPVSFLGRMMQRVPMVR